MKKHELMANSSGRTLLELCIATGLLSLLAGISAPQLRATQQHIEVRGVATQIAELSSQLTILANQQGVELTLRKSADSLILTPSRAGTKPIRQINLPAKVSISVNTHGQRIIAYPSGVVSPGKIIVSNKKRRCSITLSLWGRVRSTCQ